jgi:hypothetical protein
MFSAQLSSAIWKPNARANSPTRTFARNLAGFYCQNFQKLIKNFRFLDFCALADALDAISQIHFIFKNEIYHHQFLSKIENRLCELKTWKSLFTSQVKNKASKIAFVLQHFQTFGYFPKKFIR